MAQTCNIGTAGGNKTAQVISIGSAAGNLTAIAGWVGTSAGNKQFFSNFGVSIAAGVRLHNQGSPNHTFGTNTATVTGGVGPFTYQWLESDDGAGTWTLGTPTTANCAPSVSGVAGGSAMNLKCKVTDTGSGQVQTSNDAIYFFGNTT